MKFMRRPDIDVQTRINIVLVALFCQGMYGTITRLAREYKVSRTFIYELIWTANLVLLEAFSENNNSRKRIKNTQLIDKAILLLRLEGNCSIQSISNILEQMGFYPCSEGHISGRLRYYGLNLPNTLESESIQLVMFLSDEIFANSQPILITIEPHSTAALRIEIADDRTSETWKEHWIEIVRNKYYTLGLVSDRGKGLVEGFKEAFKDKPHYTDLFHEFRELAKVIFVELEKEAYRAIRYEEERKRVLDSVRSDRVLNKRIEQYKKAEEAMEKAIELYDSLFYLYSCIKESLEIFDKEGNLRDIDSVRGEMLTALELMNELSHEKVKGIVEKLMERIDEILLYFQRAKEVCQRLSEQIEDKEVLRALCLAWQWAHKLYQAKTAKQKDFCTKERDFWLDYTEGLLGQDIQNLKEAAFSELDTVVRSSSLIEMVNSLIRPYLNTCKGKITQESLNLIMFYHNYRKYNDGKRKGKAPIEILTGKSLKKHWVDLLLDYSDSEVGEESEGGKVLFNSKAFGKAIAEASL